MQGENERHNLMPLVVFFTAVHTTHQHCVLSVSCFIHESIHQWVLMFLFIDWESSGVPPGATTQQRTWGRNHPEAGTFFKLYKSEI